MRPDLDETDGVRMAVGEGDLDVLVGRRDVPIGRPPIVGGVLEGPLATADKALVGAGMVAGPHFVQVQLLLAAVCGESQNNIP